jgi:tRNA nucleotidyltransferase (CCA-adding enzyme)
MIPDNVKTIMQSLIDNGFDAYIIGGAVRDVMMGVVPSDWDIFTDASGHEILSIFPYGNIIGGEERRAKILTVVVDGVEVSQYRANGDRTKTGTSLDRHLSTCDFRINSMAMDIDCKITDNHYGRMYIKERAIYCVGDCKDRIKEDKLRALRAVRFGVKYNFVIDPELYRVILNTDISDLPIERVKDELLKTIIYPDAISTMARFNLINKIVPEFTPSVQLDGGRHHDETVDQHMFNAQNIACALTDNPILVFACAFHDIGKPSTQEHKEDGGTSFHNHDRVGAEMLREIMLRLKFSNMDIKYVGILVSEHMFGYASDARCKNGTFVKHFKRLEDAGISIEDYMILQYSDSQANTKNSRMKFGDFIQSNKLYKKYFELRHSNTPFGIRDIAISGKDLLDIGIPAGREIGDTLNEIFDVVASGDLENTRPALMYYLKNVRQQ